MKTPDSDGLNIAWDLQELDPTGRALDRKAPTPCHGTNRGFPDDTWALTYVLRPKITKTAHPSCIHSLDGLPYTGLPPQQIWACRSSSSFL